MSGDPALIAILADLWKIRHWCNKHPSQELPPSAVTYLCANEDTLLCLIACLVSTSRAVRSTVHSEHRELDETVIEDNCSVVCSVVKKACLLEEGNRLIQVTDDDVNMILRPIEYVKYLDCDSCPPVVLSPIQLPT